MTSMRPDDGHPAGPDLAAVPRTGVGAVDAALDDVLGAAGESLEEQVLVLERAHEQLRAALDDTA